MNSVRAVAVSGTLLLALVGALAQEQPRPPAAPVVGVAIESSDGRIRNWSPEFLREAAAVVEKSAKNARVVILGLGGKGTADTARKYGVDYLITIELSPRPYAQVGLGGQGTVDLEVTSHPRANAQGSIFLAWTVQALNGKPIKLHDSRTVQAAEYPLGPSYDWLRVIASRSIRDAAAEATSKLKKKAGF